MADTRTIVRGGIWGHDNWRGYVGRLSALCLPQVCTFWHVIPDTSTVKKSIIGMSAVPMRFGVWAKLGDGSLNHTMGSTSFLSFMNVRD